MQIFEPRSLHSPARACGRRHFYGPLPSGSLRAAKSDRLRAEASFLVHVDHVIASYQQTARLGERPCPTAHPVLTGLQHCPPTPRLASRILCTRYNAALSGLDAMALRLFQKFDGAIRQKRRGKRVFLFDGSDFERWLLKTLCGAVFSRNAHTRAVSTDWSPSPLWLSILYGGAAFPDRWGFYFAGDSADSIGRRSPAVCGAII
jgi:hypothetical protein